jgi:hypothetical protein
LAPFHDLGEEAQNIVWRRQFHTLKGFCHFKISLFHSFAHCLFFLFWIPPPGGLFEGTGCPPRRNRSVFDAGSPKWSFDPQNPHRGHKNGPRSRAGALAILALFAFSRFVGENRGPRPPKGMKNMPKSFLGDPERVAL